MSIWSLFPLTEKQPDSFLLIIAPYVCKAPGSEAESLWLKPFRHPCQSLVIVPPCSHSTVCMHAITHSPRKYSLRVYHVTHRKRPWFWERLMAGGEGGNRGWNGWMSSSTQWTHLLNEFEQTLGDNEGQGSLECCSPWDRKELDTTEQPNNSKCHVAGATLGSEIHPGTNRQKSCPVETALQLQTTNKKPNTQMKQYPGQWWMPWGKVKQGKMGAKHGGEEEASDLE